MKLTYLFLTLAVSLLTNAVSASTTFDKVAVDTLKGLQSSAKVEHQTFAISETLSPRALKQVRKIAGLWKRNRLANLEQFKVAESKDFGSVAVVIVATREKHHPLRSAVHPVGLLKKNGGWKVVPMVSDFQFADLGIDQELSDQIKLAEQWIAKREAIVYKNAFLQAKLAFQQKLDKHSETIESTCKTSDDLFEFFLTQVDKRSIAGVCAAMGVDLDASSHHDVDTDNLIQSLYQGLQSKHMQVGAWQILRESKKSRVVVAKIDKPKFDDVKSDVFGLAIVNPAKRNGVQMAGFTVKFTKSERYIRIPDELILTSYGNDLIKEFVNVQFEVSQLPDDLRPIQNKVSELLLKSLKPRVRPTVELQLSSLKQAEVSDNLLDWLSHFSCGLKLSNDDAELVLKNLFEEWNTRFEKRSYLALKYHYSKSGNECIVTNFSIGSSVNNSFVAQQWIRKLDEGWVVVPCKILPANFAALDRLSKLVVVDKEQAYKLLIDKVSSHVSLVQWAGVKSPPKGDKFFKEGIKKYFVKLQKGDLLNMATETYALDSKLKHCLSNLKEELSEIKLGGEREIIRLSSDKKGTAFCCVKLTRKGVVNYAVYLMVNHKGKFKVDMQNRLGIGRASAVHLNRRVWLNISQRYGSDRHQFLKHTYDEMVELIEEDSLEF